MDDIMEKLGELLSDEESVKQIVELAKMMTSDENAEGSGDSPDEDPVSKTDVGFDISSLTKLSGLIGAASKRDKNAELLLALKPHLREEKQKRVDKALKILKLIAVWNIAKESGLLSDIL